MSSEEMIRMLRENALYEVPAHIAITLQQWGEQAGKLYIEEVTLLRCRSEDIAEPCLKTRNAFHFLVTALATQTLSFCGNILQCLRSV